MVLWFGFRCSLILLAIVLMSSSARAQQTEVQFLSGHGKDDGVPWRFCCTSGANSGFWTNLPVPSQWDVQGFGTVHYQKDLTNAFDEKGLYQHEFTVPAGWSGRRIFLVFDGVMTDTDARLNGQSVGPTHQGGFYRFKYEVTPLVKFGGANLLEVTVAKHSANKSINGAERNADYWVFGGIFRPVSLEAVPPQFIERVAIDARADGSFAADVYLNGVTNGEVEAQIQTLDGKNIGEPVAAGILPAVEPGFQSGGQDGDNPEATEKSEAIPSNQAPVTESASLTGSTNGGKALTAEKTDAMPGGRMPPSTAGKMPAATIHAQIPAPKLWTAETPNLYQVELRLKQNGRVIHEIRQRFGFRTMEVRAGDGLYVNGRKIILRGINRHSFWPESGRTLSEAVQRLDINIMKDANLNAVRMSHYPPDAQFLDLCDELGLYVLDELGGWHHFYDNDVGPKLVREMVVRDVNHPCILFWDNGNEGGFNPHLDRLFGQYDPQRRRVLHPWTTFSGLNTAHYLAYDKAEIAATGQRVYYSKNQELVDTNDPAKYIYMPTEFLHGLYDGGAGAGMDDYWRMMTSHPLCAGGFVWALLDDGLKRPDTGEIDVVGNEAPDGIVGPYRQKEGSYFALKEIWSPIQVARATNGTFTVENHFNFTDARDCKFSWQLRQYASPLDTNSGFAVLREGVWDSPGIPPGQTGSLTLNGAASRNADALALRVDDPAGRELWTWVWPLRDNDFHRLAEEPAQHHAVPSATNGILSVTTGDLTASFSQETGRLLGVRRGAQTFSLTNGPRLAVGQATLRQIHFDDDGPDAFVSAKYDGDLKSVFWRVNGNGWINCDYTYSAQGTNDFIGVLFDYPESLVTHKRWLGDGPYRVWKNRLRGVTFGLWENNYNHTIAGWRDWIYPEFKGIFAGVRWLQLDTAEGMITVLNNNNAVPYVQVLEPEFPPAKLAGKAVAPVAKCGLAFLDAIPPIGSKFKAAREGGPQGQPSAAAGDYSGSLSFYFGPLPAP
jgi:hypothetical protein